MSFNRHNIPTHKSSTEQQSPLAPAPRHLYFSSYRPPALALTMPKRPSSIALSPSSSPSPSSNMPKSKPWSGSDTLKKSKADHIPSWNLKGGRGGIDSLPEIPFYQVPSSTFAVIQETNPQAVAQRIVDAVAHMSSVGNYNNELSTATIHTITNVKLSISLFRNADDKILVELLRVNGDVMGFHRAARVILAAAQNIPLPVNLDATATAGAPTSRRIVTVIPNRHERSTPAARMKEEQQGQGQGQGQGLVDVVSSTMEKIQSLMKKDRMDAVLLGMESLELLVNASSSKQETVLSASKAILCNGGIWQDVKDILFGLVMDRTMHLGEEGTDQTEYDSKFHLALTILANALDCICIAGIDFEIDMEEMKGLLSALKDYSEEQVSCSSSSSSSEIMNHVHVQAIYQAARCIRSLIDLSPDFRSTALDIGIIDVANELLRGGASRHQLLANVSESIVSILAEAQPKIF